jgi:hypothetical protein
MVSGYPTCSCRTTPRDQKIGCAFLSNVTVLLLENWRSPSRWRKAQPWSKLILQAYVAEIDLHMRTITKRRSPASVEIQLQKIVEAVAYIVSRFSAAAIATKGDDKCFRSDVLSSHGDTPASDEREQ